MPEKRQQVLHASLHWFPLVTSLWKGMHIQNSREKKGETEGFWKIIYFPPKCTIRALNNSGFSRKGQHSGVFCRLRKTRLYWFDVSWFGGGFLCNYDARNVFNKEYIIYICIYTYIILLSIFLQLPSAVRIFLKSQATFQVACSCVKSHPCALLADLYSELTSAHIHTLCMLQSYK